MTGSGTRPPVLVIAIGVAFAALLLLLVALSLAPRHVETFALGRPAPSALAPGGADTVTLDVQDPDAWRYFDLDRGAVLVPPDTLGWDLAARRFQLRVPAGAARRLTSPGRDRWYRYDFLAHLLRPRGLTYAVRTDAGTDFSFAVLSYYCPGPTAGCLTIRYALDSAGAGTPP